MNRGSRCRIASYLICAAATVPPGTVPRTSSDRSNPASIIRATIPTLARRLGALKRGRPGRFRHDASATPPERLLDEPEE